jgi:uncharacterized membrane protein
LEATDRVVGVVHNHSSIEGVHVVRVSTRLQRRSTRAADLVRVMTVKFNSFLVELVNIGGVSLQRGLR